MARDGSPKGGRPERFTTALCSHGMAERNPVEEADATGGLGGRFGSLRVIYVAVAVFAVISFLAFRRTIP